MAHMSYQEANSRSDGSTHMKTKQERHRDARDSNHAQPHALACCSFQGILSFKLREFEVDAMQRKQISPHMLRTSGFKRSSKVRQRFTFPIGQREQSRF